jgi:NitT/TauT family transport system ATP-binding protein
MSKSAIAFQSVSKRFPVPGRSRHPEYSVALENLTFHVADGEAVGLVGPSGCGKSTTLRLIAGLDFPDEGRVLVKGREVQKPDLSVGFMLQKDLLLPWKTVLENAELGLMIRGIPKHERQDRAAAILTKYGLGDFVRYRPHQLSGGMRQRVALARTMAIGPKVLLLDEPFASVDFQTKLLLQQDLLAILEQTKTTVLYITHDIGEALSLCSRVLVMSHRPGHVKSEHPVTIPHTMSVVEKRNHPSFNNLFQSIWKDLEYDLRTTRV